MSEEIFHNEVAGELPPDLIQSLEAEVPALFDFLVRMTGSLSRAEETTEEVLDLMRKVKKEVPYQEVRVALYSLARKLNKSYWNRYTEKLKNEGFTGESPDEQELLKLESLLGKLDGEEREKILLKHRISFDDEQICKVMSLPTTTPIQLGNLLSELGALSPSQIKKIPNHPVPQTTLYQTKALSEMMQSFESKKKSLGNLKWVVVASLIALAVWFFATR